MEDCRQLSCFSAGRVTGLRTLSFLRVVWYQKLWRNSAATGSIAAINVPLNSSANEVGNAGLPTFQFGFFEVHFPIFPILLELDAGASQDKAAGTEGGQGPISRLDSTQNTRKCSSAGSRRLSHFSGGRVTSPKA